MWLNDQSGCDVIAFFLTGLTSTLKFCQMFRDVYAPQLSMADVIAFLGKEAVKIAAKKAGK